jgi:hypothetical protein
MWLMNPAASDAADIISYSSEQPEHPASNVLSYHPSDVWRCAENTQAYIDFDFGTATTVDSLAILYHNIARSGTIRLVGATSIANLETLDGDFSTSNITPWGGNGLREDMYYFHRRHTFYKISPAQTYRYWRIYFNQVADIYTPPELRVPLPPPVIGGFGRPRGMWFINPDVPPREPIYYIPSPGPGNNPNPQIGRILLGTGIDLSSNASPSYSIDIEYENDVSETPGMLYSRRSNTRRVITVRLSNLRETATTGEDLFSVLPFHHVDNWDAFLLITDDDVQDSVMYHVFYVRLDRGSITYPDWDLYTDELTFEEIELP